MGMTESDIHLAEEAARIEAEEKAAEYDKITAATDADADANKLQELLGYITAKAGRREALESQADPLICELRRAAEEVDKLVEAMIEAEAAAATYKAIDLAQAKEAHAMAMTMAQTEAWAADICNGKNAETRAVQLADFLAKHTGLQAAAKALSEAEQRMAELEAEANAARNWFLARKYRAADLQAAAGLLAAVIGN